MLNGLNPILIFQFKKISPETLETIQKIPVVSSIVNQIGLPPIPIYLDEQLTGLAIAGEDKNVNVETTTDSTATGGQPLTNQKPIGSTIRVNMEATRGGVGLTLLSAVIDLILPLLTSKEYSITYISGATTIFGGLLHDFSITSDGNSTKLAVALEISRTTGDTKAAATTPVVQPIGESVNLSSGLSNTSSLVPPMAGPPLQPVAPPPVPIGPLR